MQDIEKRITNKLVRAALDAGFNISVSDGEAYPVKRSTNFNEITAALGSTDSDSLIIRDSNANRIGSVLLIYGNDDAVISDHTDNEIIGKLVETANG